jgi:hypothetical protein
MLMLMLMLMVMVMVMVMVVLVLMLVLIICIFNIEFVATVSCFDQCVWSVRLFRCFFLFLVKDEVSRTLEMKLTEGWRMILRMADDSYVCTVGYGYQVAVVG